MLMILAQIRQPVSLFVALEAVQDTMPNKMHIADSVIAREQQAPAAAATRAMLMPCTRQLQSLRSSVSLIFILAPLRAPLHSIR